jgi:UDP-glucuronate decarboxylase
MSDLAKLYGEVIPGTTFTQVGYPDTYPAGEPQRRCPDLRKAAEHVGYSSTVDLREGLSRFVDWARHQPSYRAE